MQAPTAHHPPVLNRAVGHGSSGQSAVTTGFPLSAIPRKPCPGKLAAAPNPHRRPSPHRSPAGSFFGGFPTPALLRGPPLALGRHPKPFPEPVVPGNSHYAAGFEQSTRIRRAPDWPAGADLMLLP